jgi:hypothetical protein
MYNKNFMSDFFDIFNFLLLFSIGIENNNKKLKMSKKSDKCTRVPKRHLRTLSLFFFLVSSPVSETRNYASETNNPHRQYVTLRIRCPRW